VCPSVGRVCSFPGRCRATQSGARAARGAAWGDRAGPKHWEAARLKNGRPTVQVFIRGRRADCGRRTSPGEAPPAQRTQRKATCRPPAQGGAPSGRTSCCMLIYSPPGLQVALGRPVGASGGRPTTRPQQPGATRRREQPMERAGGLVAGALHVPRPSRAADVRPRPQLQARPSHLRRRPPRVRCWFYAFKATMSRAKSLAVQWGASLAAMHAQCVGKMAAACDWLASGRSSSLPAQRALQPKRGFIISRVELVFVVVIIITISAPDVVGRRSEKARSRWASPRKPGGEWRARRHRALCAPHAPDSPQSVCGPRGGHFFISSPPLPPDPLAAPGQPSF